MLSFEFLYSFYCNSTQERQDNGAVYFCDLHQGERELGDDIGRGGGGV